MIVVITWIIPMHPMAIMIFLIVMTVDNVYGHLGWELYPRSLHRTWVGKWINTSVNHNMHHKYNRRNYGLYFRFWDELMGTTHERYLETFEKTTR